MKHQPLPPPMPPTTPRTPEADLVRFLAEVEKLFENLGSRCDSSLLSGTTELPDPLPGTPSSASAQGDTRSSCLLHSSEEKQPGAEANAAYLVEAVTSTSSQRAAGSGGCDTLDNSIHPTSPAAPPPVLEDVWARFGECSTLGLEVPTLGSERGPSLAYFTPFLSAMQIFAVPEHLEDSQAEGRCRVPTLHSLGVHNVDSELAETPSPSDGDGSSDILEDAGVHRQRCTSGNISDGSVFDNGECFLQSDACSTFQESIEHEFAPCGDVSSLPLVWREQPQTKNSSSATVLHLVANWAANCHAWERPPLAQHIEELSGGHGDATGRKLPLPAALRHVPLHSIHPASWFAVLWHPLYRIPDADLKARFITYHSFGDAATLCGNAQQSPVVRLAGCLMGVGDSTAPWTDHTVTSPDGNVVRWPNGMERELKELEGGADALSKSTLYHTVANGSVVAEPLDHFDYKFVCSLRA
jgi:hypothetical protein